MQNDLTIRFARREDLPSMVDIYNQAIRSKRSTGDLDEFKVEDRIAWFEKFSNQSFPLYICETDGKLIGYCSISPYRPGRRAMKHVAEISYYVDFNYHGQGIASKLLNFVIADCQRVGISKLLAILLDINTGSIALLEKLKFKKWGHFPNIIQMDQVICGQFVYGLSLRN